MYFKEMLNYFFKHSTTMENRDLQNYNYFFYIYIFYIYNLHCSVIHVL